MGNFGDLIKREREAAGLTQEQLGEKIGVTGVTIMRYEKNQREPRLEQLRKIAVALDVTVSDFVDGDYWETLPDSEKQAAFSDNPQKELLLTAFGQLNSEGQNKAVERVEELTEIPKYKKETPPEK